MEHDPIGQTYDRPFQPGAIPWWLDVCINQLPSSILTLSDSAKPADNIPTRMAGHGSWSWRASRGDRRTPGETPSANRPKHQDDHGRS